VRKAHAKRLAPFNGWLFWPIPVLMLGAIPGANPYLCAALAEEKPVTPRLQSAAFAEGGTIPKKYTCEGTDISPPIAWSGMPQGTKSFVLIVDDPDAPDPKAPKMTWVHWVLYNLPAGSIGLPEGVEAGALPPGTMGGLNDWKREGYGGPCPPIGRHRYFFKLYALDTVLSGLKQPGKAAVEAAMKNHVLGQATLMGTYEKGH
jgi:Raf kinase inhibitor-like YbhB/YbcL family protein